MSLKRAIRPIVLLLILVAAVTGGSLLYDRRDRADGQTAASNPSRQISVVLAKARTMEFRRELVVQGNVQSKRFAMVSPRVSGVLDAIYVDEGDEVEVGKTRLFQTDSVKLGEAVEVNRHGVTVAESSLRVKQASQERTEAEYDKAEFDWRRYQDLHERNVVADTEVQEVKSAYKQAGAMLKHARALVALSEAELQQSRSSLAIAQKDLEDSLVKAPVSGRVTKRYREPGEMGDSGQAVLRIEDPSLVEMSASLPAEVYGLITPKKTTMHVSVNGVDVGQHVVSYKSPTIDPKLRTFEVQCLMRDPPSAVAPGAMADIRIVLERRQGLGVARDAIQERGGESVVFVVDDQVARMVPVQVGLETEGFVEIASGGLKQGADVVVMGGFFLKPGSPVQVLQGTH